MERADSGDPASADCRGTTSRAPLGSVLVVDDEEANRKILRRLCLAAGAAHVIEAPDAIAALSLLEAETPDLVLLDVRMPPGIDGLETCRRLRTDPRHARLPVLIQSGLADRDTRARAFMAGATDVVSKPFDVPELRARVRIHLENRLLMRSLEAFRARMDVHLALAGKLMRSLLPSPAARAEAEGRAGVAIDAFRLPAEEVGGDLWTLRRISRGRVLLLLIDAVGHGLAAAINAFRVEAILGDLPDDDPAAILAELDRRLVALDDGRLTAAVTAVAFGAETSTVTLLAAGAPPPLLLRSDGRRPEPVATGGLPVGTGLFTPRPAALRLDPGDALLLYSDGWVDASERAAALVERARAAGEHPTAEGLADAAEPNGDDRTVILLTRRTR